MLSVGIIDTEGNLVPGGDPLPSQCAANIAGTENGYRQFSCRHAFFSLSLRKLPVGMCEHFSLKCCSIPIMSYECGSYFYAQGLRRATARVRPYYTPLLVVRV